MSSTLTRLHKGVQSSSTLPLGSLHPLDTNSPPLVTPFLLSVSMILVTLDTSYWGTQTVFVLLSRTGFFLFSVMSLGFTRVRRLVIGMQRPETMR